MNVILYSVILECSNFARIIIQLLKDFEEYSE